MTKKTVSRRDLLAQSAGLIPLCGLLPLATGASAADLVCVAADAEDKSLRDSLHYVEKSPDPQKTCNACGLYMAAAAGCGHCGIFNGPANPAGHCDSWSAKS
jgi:hypothetical protein